MSSFVKNLHPECLRNAQAWHLGQCQWLPFYVDLCQEFHQTSFCSPIALKANLLFDVHLDE
jgi:hypothetical protein